MHVLKYKYESGKLIWNQFNQYLFQKFSYLVCFSCSVFFFQFLIVVVDSTDRERLAVTKAELYNMLNHEVSYIDQNTLMKH